MNYSTDSFFQFLYQMVGERKALHSCKEVEIESLVDSKREQLYQLLRIDFYKNLKHTIQYERISEVKFDSYTLIQYDVTFLPYLTAPVWVLEPKESTNKAVLYCHGHDSYGAKGSFINYGDQKNYHKFFPIKLVEQGYHVVIPEFVGFGDMVKKDYKVTAENGCYANSSLLMLHGLSMAGIRVFEAMSMLTLMIEHWDMKSISAYGVSGGGLVVTYLSALDKRINASVISSYGATFESSIMAMRHCIDNYTPGILEIGECSEILGLSVPTPLLLTSGIEDPIFPVEGTKKTIDALSEIYRRFNQSDKLHIELFDGKHEISLEKVFDFIKQYNLSE